jgi:hypothetical protein
MTSEVFKFLLSLKVNIKHCEDNAVSKIRQDHINITPPKLADTVCLLSGEVCLLILFLSGTMQLPVNDYTTTTYKHV